MKRFLITIIIILCLAAGAGAALQLTGTVDFGEYLNRKDNESEAAFYVSFMDDYFLMDSSGIVLMSTLSSPEGIPRIENMRFNSFTVGCEADAKSGSTFDYVQEVCSLLDAYSISVSYIDVSDDGSLTLYLEGEKFSVVLGENEDTDIKIKDLNSLYSSLMEYEGGILYMTSADTNGQGYTFKEISDDETEEDGDDEDEEDESDESEETTAAAEEETVTSQTEETTAAAAETATAAPETTAAAETTTEAATAAPETTAAETETETAEAETAAQ